MALPYFFVAAIEDKTIVLDEDTSKHVVNVLRMQKGEELLLTNGKGIKAKAIITDDNRKRCAVKITSSEKEEALGIKTTIGISLLKNASRFEWFLEKATEIGVSEIVPLLCERTEKDKFRFERLNAILISAMLQSQQCWLPVLHQPTGYAAFVNSAADDKKRFIAHCEELRKQTLTGELEGNTSDKLMLIGPEGDFTRTEIELAINKGFVPVSLGETRLRTETAGMVAATLLRMCSDGTRSTQM